MIIKRSVPFLAASLRYPDKHALLIDKLEILDNDISQTNLMQKITQALHITQQPYITSSDAILLVTAQYDCCLEYMYAHPFWKNLQREKGLIFGYLLETMHYLAAASHRMAHGIHKNYHCEEFFVNLSATHTLEEHNHNIFFERALKAEGFDVNVLKITRPLPTTTEWICLMQTIAMLDPLCAVLTSGLLEYTVQEQEIIKNWHTMLVEKQILSQAAADAIYAHVQLDMQLNHSENWQNALNHLQTIDSNRLTVCLNCIATVAEMYVRWLDSLNQGMSSHYLQLLAKIKPIITHNHSGLMNALPVFSAKIYPLVTFETSLMTHGTKDIVAFSYYLSHAILNNSIDCQNTVFIEVVRNNIYHTTKHSLDVNFITISAVKILMQESWLLAINGHNLWYQLLQNTQYSMIYGWIYENYYYISSIEQHVGAAIAACTDPAIRNELVKHLKEEIGHGKILKKPLESSKYHLSVVNCRPLATTLLFVGSLTQIATSNWKAYCLVLYYLQLTVKNCTQNFSGFYSKIIQNVPTATALVDAMRLHDELDLQLNHDGDCDLLLELLFTRHVITIEELQMAAHIVQLLWSFLDGINQHYQHGDMAVLQRIGWYTYAN